jgi:ring-1,2-phenylacetyl-CoA epoxidase subunit PaaB
MYKERLEARRKAHENGAWVREAAAAHAAKRLFNKYRHAWKPNRIVKIGCSGKYSFVPARTDHKHAGSLYAADAQMAIENARDVYTRRNEGISIWVVESKNIHASNPDDAGEFFDPASDKIYRHPSFYHLPEQVKNI